MDPATGLTFMPAQLEKIVPFLIRPGNELLQGLLTNDRRGVLRQVAADLGLSLGAEACAIFLVSEAEPDTLQFVAGSSEKIETAWGDRRLSIQQLQKNEWLGEAIHRREPVHRQTED